MRQQERLMQEAAAQEKLAQLGLGGSAASVPVVGEFDDSDSDYAGDGGASDDDNNAAGSNAGKEAGRAVKFAPKMAGSAKNDDDDEEEDDDDDDFGDDDDDEDFDE